MAVRVSLARCPLDTDMADTGGLPWGATLTPFASQDETEQKPLQGTHGERLPRCESCYGYLNVLCEIYRWNWTCSLCGYRNHLSREHNTRYANPSDCPELSSSFVDFDLQEEEGSIADQPWNAKPVYVAAIDLSASEEFLELVKSALLAALEAVGPGALFGLMTFSHKIGLYDVQGAVPLIKKVMIPAEPDARIPVELEDAMPLSGFLAPVEGNKENIASALDSLKPTSSWERTTAAGQGIEGISMGGRGFGVAMEALIKYLGGGQGTTFALARVFAFLSGPPDYGAGQLDTRRYGEQYASKGLDADKALLPEQTPFYKELAALAVQTGVCVDQFAVTDEYTDLASLKYLSIESGGSILLYSNTDESTLPQDLYRMLTRPFAFGCVLRLRTSPEFKIARAYGHFFADPQYENMQHIICCNPYQTYAYDFEFKNSNYFARDQEAPPVLQAAFQYSVMLPADNEKSTTATPSGTSEGPSSTKFLTGSRSVRFVLKRRLRIRTLQLGVARNYIELYEGADPEVILSILTHKIMRVCLEEGVKEGRLLLHDWLVILTAQYNAHYKFAQFGEAKSRSQLDVTFSKCTQLQPLPRLVFALLRNPLLRVHEEGVHPDYRIYLQCLFGALDPSSLLRAIYPVLSSYLTPDKQAYPRHSLSRAALITSGSPIFFLDSFTSLVVYYAPTADPSLPFPPPQNSVLRATINRLKQDRNITPKLYVIRGGHDSTEPFDCHLIEEQDVNGSGMATGMGFVSFLDQIASDVWSHMQS